MQEGMIDDIVGPDWEGTTTCRVAAVIHFDGGIASRVECDPLPPEAGRGTGAVSGMYIADARGLYHAHGDLPADGTRPTYDKTEWLFSAADDPCWSTELLDGNEDELCVDNGRISYAREYWTSGGGEEWIAFSVPS
jgi:hypothetical protein